MKILLIEPFFTGSHEAWALGLKREFGENFQILSLPGRHWKWRMHGGALTLGRIFMESDFVPDLILATDMLDLTTFLAVTRKKTAQTKTVIYFHENQLTYPWSPSDLDVSLKRDMHYGFINVASAVAADFLLFNSEYHKKSFCDSVKIFFETFPDCNESDAHIKIREKSVVLPLGLDLEKFDKIAEERSPNKVPLILWNHRWEYDKNPEQFFLVLKNLMDKGLDFEIAVLGEEFPRAPKIFSEIDKIFGNRIVHKGFVESFADYARWLKKSDILPVTSNQDFFGISIVEATYCGVIPLLPERLSYPEIFPFSEFSEFFYNKDDELERLLEKLLVNRDSRRNCFVKNSEKYKWNSIISLYKKAFEQIIKT